MRLVKPFLLIFVLTLAVSCAASCAASSTGGSSHPSVSDVTSAWFQIRTKLLTQDYNLPDLETQLNGFKDITNRFIHSPIGDLFLTHRTFEMDKIAEIESSVDELILLLNSNDDLQIMIIMDIDQKLELLQSVDTDLSDTSHLNYFLLFFFFSVVTLIIILALGFIYSSLEKAEKREQQSLAFSRETMIIQEQERSRIARELHDTIAQDLWRLSFQTESIIKTENQTERNRLCGEVVNEQKNMIKRIKNICDNLAPPDFKYHRLDNALQNLCYNFEQRTNIECQLILHPELQFGFLNTDKQLQVFRITQEALANIEKHSRASDASASVEVSVLVRNTIEGDFLLCVSDNGCGFSMQNRDFLRQIRTKGHFGLWNMTERAASIGGELDIDSEAGEGTVITLRIGGDL